MMKMDETKVAALAVEFEKEIDQLERKYTLMLVAYGSHALAAQQIILLAAYANFLRGKKALETTMSLVLPEADSKQANEVLNNALADVSQEIEASSKERSKEIEAHLAPLLKALRDAQ